MSTITGYPTSPGIVPPWLNPPTPPQRMGEHISKRASWTPLDHTIERPSPGIPVERETDGYEDKVPNRRYELEALTRKIAARLLWEGKRG